MTALLKVEALDVFYGDLQALHGVSLSLEEGRIGAVIGANGAGKTTLLRAISGMQSKKTGEIWFENRSLMRDPGERVARAGVAMVPEGRLLYPSLTVEENILMGAAARRKGPWTLGSVYDLFPALLELRHLPGTAVSGGQQQMVAIGRALLSNPKLLLCDEISLGLAPKVVGEIYGCFQGLVASGLSILVVEQDVRRALSVASEIHCLLSGRISLSRPSAAVDFDEVAAAYFGV